MGHVADVFNEETLADAARPSRDRPHPLLDGRREHARERAAVPDRLRARADRRRATTATSSTPASCATSWCAAGSIFQTTSDTEVILHLYARSKAPTVEDALVESIAQVSGAYSLVAADQEPADRRARSARVPSARARPARRRLDRLFGDLRARSDRRHLRPRRRARRAAVISDGGLRSIKPFPPAPLAHCVFEHVYFARPDSYVFGRSVNEVRTDLGPPPRRASRRSTPTSSCRFPTPASARRSATPRSRACRCGWA